MNYCNICPGCMQENGLAIICPNCGYEEGAVPESLLHLPTGTILQDKYMLGKVLGQGGFGITYLAWDKTLKLKLAIKEYFPQQLVTRTGGLHKVNVYKASLSEDFKYGLTKFLEEARTLARFIEHPNVVSVRDYFEANGTAYLVMNYQEGITLQSYLDSKGGKIPLEQALSIFMPVLDALKEVHAAGILHRDISPDNLLIDKSGRVVLIDFGAARQAMGEKSKSLSVIMKAGYSPPEQYQSRGIQGSWSDIYAVAASFYRAITGQAPLEAIDRMAKDDLKTPSQLGVKIDVALEKNLLKAMAVDAEKRYRSVEEFQAELFGAGAKGDVKEDYTGLKQMSKAEVNAGTAGLVAGHLLPPQQPLDQTPIGVFFYAVSKKPAKKAALVLVFGLLFYGGVSLFNGGKNIEKQIGSELDQVKAFLEEDGPDKISQINETPVLIGSDADYYIDYENGTIPIGDLPIGTRVVDPSWEWEFRTGFDRFDEWEDNPTGYGDIRPITWIVVAKNHYKMSESHVTLLSKNIIGHFAFDNSKDRGNQNEPGVVIYGYGHNHWGESGTTNATNGLRPWLNSIGIHLGVGLYESFSEEFKKAIVVTELPNREWKNGEDYITLDNVFIPSTTELGDIANENSYQIGFVYPYFLGTSFDSRIAMLVGDDYIGGITGEIPAYIEKSNNNSWSYWTRSPSSIYGAHLKIVSHKGDIKEEVALGGLRSTDRPIGVRPALNIKDSVMVREIKK